MRVQCSRMHWLAECWGNSLEKPDAAVCKADTLLWLKLVQKPPIPHTQDRKAIERRMGLAPSEKMVSVKDKRRRIKI